MLWFIYCSNLILLIFFLSRVGQLDVKAEILEKKINKGKVKKQRSKLKDKNQGRKSGWIKKEIKNEDYEGIRF